VEACVLGDTANPTAPQPAFPRNSLRFIIPPDDYLNTRSAVRPLLISMIIL
jgi:hypothetical protein